MTATTTADKPTPSPTSPQTAPTKTPAPLEPSPSASPPLMTHLRWKSTTPLPSTRAQPPATLSILDNDTDSPDNGTLAVYSVGGTTFASLTDSTDSTYTSANGYKQVAGTYGTLYIKSTGESYYVHDGGDDGGQTDSFSYVATDGTNQDTSSAGTISLSIAAVDDTLRWKSTTPLPSTRAQPPATSTSSPTTPILPITAPSPSTASVARPSRH